MLQTDVTAIVSCLLHACTVHLKGTAPLTVWPYCSCSGLCAGVSPSEKQLCGRESVSRHSREKHRSGRAAAVASSDNTPGQRARLCLGTDPAEERRALTRLIRPPCLYFIPRITVFDVEASGHGRVFTSLTRLEVIWETCADAQQSA